jgi:hypothetical protein
VDPLALTHVIAVFLWFGVIAAEVTIELRAREPTALREVAEDHFWIDAVVEVPLLCIVLGTGLLLSARASPLTGGLIAMVVCGTLAVAANVACVGFVFARRRSRADLEALRAHRRRIFACAIVGAPFGLVATIVGLSRML